MYKLAGKITGLSYESFLQKELPIFSFDSDVNTWSASCAVKQGDSIYAVSKWLSPKRTRSYPYARVYETLSRLNTKITIIPIVKDEGKDGERDYLQWDTVSLMSLLNVYVILAYYVDAERSKRPRSYEKPDKITNQKLNDEFIKRKINELSNYHSSALHWNLEQLELNNLNTLMQLVIENYKKISMNTGVALHSEGGLESFKRQIMKERESFLEFSRAKAKGAQKREIATIQIKELLSTGDKCAIEIDNYLGGKYFLTIDDVTVTDGIYSLTESKHAEKGELLPKEGDIKDGLTKMIIYSNISELYDITDKEDKDSKNTVRFVPILRLTSSKIIGRITSKSKEQEITSFLRKNDFTNDKVNFVNNLFKEAKVNNFEIVIEYGARGK